MSILDLSFRYKIPLWGSVLVIVTALLVSLVLMVDAYEELEEDLIIEAQTLASGLRSNLFSALQQDNVWHGYETVSAPLKDQQGHRAENIILLDNALRVFVAARPKAARMQTHLGELGPDYLALVAEMGRVGIGQPILFRPPGSPRLFVVTPISDNDVTLGSLLIVLARDSFQPRFLQFARDGLLAGLLILGVLLPINWYWGWHMAQPLVQLTRRMEDLGRRLPERLDPALYSHRDELGSLFGTYNKVLVELQTKAELEKQIVQSDRLAALGQLAAGVAHEINNPLGGMLMAIDTLKSHGVIDSRTARTIALLERGLGQIRDTVGALLVEARLKSRNLARPDVEDVFMLVLPQVRHKELHLDWHNELEKDVPLPATHVRQVLINLLLNAVQAATQHGRVGCDIGVTEGRLRIAVTNDGKLLTAEQMNYLFEPFSPLSKDGHGLGSWVSYQIVHQLGGTINAVCIGERMQFTVDVPLGEAPA